MTNAAIRAAASARPSVEFRIRRAGDGEERWLLRAGAVIRDDAGTPLHLRGLIRDVTDRRRVEDHWRFLVRLSCWADHRGYGSRLVGGNLCGAWRGGGALRFP